MDDPLEENPIIIGLQIFIFVFLVIAIIAFICISYNNSRIRAVFRASLPNHLPFLRNRELSFLDDQNANKGLSAEKDSGKTVHNNYQDHQRNNQNFLPATLTPLGTKSSISKNDDINKISNDIFMKILEDDLNSTENSEEKKDEKSVDTKEPAQSKSPQFLDMFKKIQKDGEKNANEAKEKSKQKKQEEEEKKQKEIQKKEAEKAESNKTPSSSGLNFGLNSLSNFKFNFSKTDKKT